MPVNHTITTILVSKEHITSFDQHGEVMLYFTGERGLTTMAKIKRRIQKQIPCSIAWKVEEGVEFSNIVGCQIVHYPVMCKRSLNNSNKTKGEENESK